MRWPWTARIEAADSLAAHAEQRSGTAEAECSLYKGMWVAAHEDFEKRDAARLRELAESRAEVKLLLDRIVQMSGQPPIFHPAPIQATPPAAPEPSPKVSTMPGPETRVSFADVHRETRKAIKNGDINLLTRTN